MNSQFREILMVLVPCF